MSQTTQQKLEVTQELINEIVARAQASQFGLQDPKAPLDVKQYTGDGVDVLALILVNGWVAKYDLVSIFAAAMTVICEKQNARIENLITTPDKNVKVPKFVFLTEGYDPDKFPK